MKYFACPKVFPCVPETASTNFVLNWRTLMSIYTFVSKLCPARFVFTAAVVAAGASVFAAPPPPPFYSPEILVTGLSTAIYDGSVQPLKLDGTYFNKAQVGVNSWEHTFEIRNFGNDDLVLTVPLVMA